MKKHLSSIVFGVLGLCAGMVIIYARFVLPQNYPDLKPMPLTIIVNHPTEAASHSETTKVVPLAHTQPPEFLVLTNVPWLQPVTPAPQKKDQHDWRNYAVPMPQPPVADQGSREYIIPDPESPELAPEHWQPQLILPMIPPKIYGGSHELAQDYAPKLIIPTIPPQQLDHQFPYAR